MASPFRASAQILGIFASPRPPSYKPPMGRRRPRTKPTTGDLFAHFGLPPVGAPQPEADTAIPRRASPCRECSWLLTSTLCPICGASTEESSGAGEDREP